jgi:taurine dioxygenase
MKLEPLSPFLAARVVGLDVRDLTPALAAEVRDALLEHRVLAFADQQLTPADFVRFAGHFGEIMPHRVVANRHPDHEQISLVTNRAADGSLGTARGATYWHIDSLYTERPQRFTMLYGLECPSVGGDTVFVDMAAAWRSLDASLRRRLPGWRAEHLHHGRRTGGTPAAWERSVHPLVHTHPQTGEQSLLVSEAHTTRILELDPPESDRLLDGLNRHVTTGRPQFAYRWHAGDLLVWDNCCLLHRGSSDYQEPRTLLRISIAGDVPIPAS